MINEKELLDFAKFAASHISDIDECDMTRVEKNMARRLVEMGLLERIPIHPDGIAEDYWVYSTKNIE